MTTVIYHRADYDGLFSAAVCAKFLRERNPDVEFIGWDYGDPAIDFPEGYVYLVDLSPDCFKAIPSDVSKLIWIDHHKSSIAKWDEQLGQPFTAYLVDGVAACRLCWQWFTYDANCNGLGWTLPKLSDYMERNVHEPLALTLAGEYDVWDLSDDRALPFQFGLTLAGVSNFYDLITLLGSSGKPQTQELCDLGESALAWQKNFAKRTADNSMYHRKWEGVKFAILGSVHAIGSMWFPESALPEDTQALMSWRYGGDGVAFSLYHAPGFEHIDLSVIASKYGGGGHKGACGFRLPLEQALEIIK